MLGQDPPVAMRHWPSVTTVVLLPSSRRKNGLGRGPAPSAGGGAVSQPACQSADSSKPISQKAGALQGLAPAVSQTRTFQWQR
jgi:hypothetical protein